MRMSIYQQKNILKNELILSPFIFKPFQNSEQSLYFGSIVIISV